MSDLSRLSDMEILGRFSALERVHADALRLQDGLLALGMKESAEAVSIAVGDLDEQIAEIRNNHFPITIRKER